MTSAFVTSTSPYTWDWNAPESVMTAPGNPRNLWTASRTIASRPGDFPRMYAFVIRICAPNRVARSRGGMIGRFGLTTGARVGVATRPCGVSSTPIRASPSRSRTSNMRGHRTAANKAFPRLRAPPRNGYAARAGSPAEHAPRDVRSHPGSGLPGGRDAVTVVGVFDGTKRRSFVQGDNLDDLPAAMERAKLLVTFNGSRFDVPFLRKAFPRMALDQIHLDLVHPLRRLGFVGGLKAIESQVGILRSEATTGLGGFDAVRLWHAYDAGDDHALDLLLEYNMEDVVNLEPLADLAHEGLRSLCLDGGFVTADRFPSRTGQPPRDVQKNLNRAGRTEIEAPGRRATASTNATRSGTAREGS